MIQKTDRVLIEREIEKTRKLSRHMPEGVSKSLLDARISELEKRLRKIDE
jgi:hypothetical protein